MTRFLYKSLVILKKIQVVLTLFLGSDIKIAAQGDPEMHEMMTLKGELAKVKL